MADLAVAQTNLRWNVKRRFVKALSVPVMDAKREDKEDYDYDEEMHDGKCKTD